MSSAPIVPNYGMAYVLYVAQNVILISEMKILPDKVGVKRFVASDREEDILVIRVQLP